MKRIVILLAVLILSACTNPYSKFYYDRTGGIDVTKAPHLILHNGEPRLLTGQNPEEDGQKMREDGYRLLGFSSFNGGSVNYNKALDQARDVHAEVVICYFKYTGTQSGSVPLTLPNNQTSTTTMSGNAYGSGGYANYNGMATTTTYGTQTTYIPYNVSRHDYFASYWIKNKPPIFGAHVKDMTDEQRKESGGNKGLAVIAVIKGSPAFRSDFFKGDILKKIGETDIYETKDLQDSLQKYQGQKVKVLFVRDNKEQEKEVQLNRIPE